jgi:predicted secreted protein with PEFG-CTERM motif
VYKIIFLIFLISTFSISPIFAQEQLGVKQLNVFTDNTAYSTGDIITITGTVEKIIPGTPIILQIFHEKTQVRIDQLQVSQNGKFTTTVKAEGELWNNDGIITIKISYGSRNTEIAFDFFIKTSESNLITNAVVNIPDSGTFDIPYRIKGGMVETITLNQNNLGLDLKINMTSDGFITLQLYREYIDSIKNTGGDEDFIIVIFNSENNNPIQSEFRQIESTDESRTIEIPLKNGDTDLQIIGTHVVPEFGTIAAIVLAVAIIAIIGVTAKSRLQLNSRY